MRQLDLDLHECETIVILGPSGQGKTVLIKLRGGKTLRGTLEGFDQHVNLYMKDSEEVTDPLKTIEIGDIVLRGDNVIMVSPPPE